MLTQDDQLLRGVLTQMIAELGHAPSLPDLAERAGLETDVAEASLRRLHDDHALLLHPQSSQPWVVHPFALSPGSCWVETEAHGYWANCLYCAFGVAAALRSDADITTRIGGEAETVKYKIRDGRALFSSDVFHLAIPPARWWDNVIAACASFQPFRARQDAMDWCERHAMPKGAYMSIDALWRFAVDWYGDYLSGTWQKRSLEETRLLFKRHGLSSEFWRI